MVKKQDIDKVMEKYKPVLKKFGEDVGKAAKKGEENVVVMSKLMKIQLDLASMSLQREKLYYDIGKEVADKLMKGTLNIEGLEKYKTKLSKIKTDGDKKRKAISRVKKRAPKSAKK